MSAQPVRFAAIEAVVCDTSISTGARCLYVLLDTYARNRGTAWPKQPTLAVRLGFCVRELRNVQRELEAAGHIRIQRGRRGNQYILSWAFPDRHADADHNPDRHADAGVIGTGVPITSLLIKNINEEGVGDLWITGADLIAEIEKVKTA